MLTFVLFSLVMELSKSSSSKALASAADREKELKTVIEWVDQEWLRYGKIPRFNDVVRYSKLNFGFKKLTKKMIVDRLRLLPVFLMSSRQQREPKRTKRERPIIVTTLGYLHCDIGFFTIKSGHPTLKYRSGYLIAADVLSRMMYISILKFSRKADSLLNGFVDIIGQFQKHNPDELVKGISFDRERSVLSHLVQNFFKENNIVFHAFQLSSSKAKRAEGSIRNVRTTIARMRNLPEYEGKPWWVLLKPAVDILNSEDIVVDGHTFPYTPEQIHESNLDDFLNLLYKNVSCYYFAQFDIAPQLVDFQYRIGTIVRPKLIVTSSAVLGEKRSEVTLEEEPFEIVSRSATPSHLMSVLKLYKCQSLFNSKKFEVFTESEITPSTDDSQQQQQ